MDVFYDQGVIKYGRKVIFGVSSSLKQSGPNTVHQMPQWDSQTCRAGPSDDEGGMMSLFTPWLLALQA